MILFASYNASKQHLFPLKQAAVLKSSYNLNDPNSLILSNLRGPEAQYAERWPVDLTAHVQAPVKAEIFPIINGVPLHTVFHYHPPIFLM